MNQLTIGKHTSPISNLRFEGYINRADGRRPHVSFMGILVGAKQSDAGEDEEPTSIWAAAIPIPPETRSWRKFDGLVIEYEGDTSWSFTCFDGVDHHAIVRNRWQFQRLAEKQFQIVWSGEIEHEGFDGKKRRQFVETEPVLLTLEVSFAGVRVSDAKSIADAESLLEEYFDLDDFAPPILQVADYWFAPLPEGRGGVVKQATARADRGGVARRRGTNRAELDPEQELRPNPLLSALSAEVQSALAKVARLKIPGTTFTEKGLVYFCNNKVNDGDVARLAGIGVEHLQLANTQVTDAGLVHLNEMTSLKSLDLARCRITSAGIAHLTSLTKLGELNLKRTQIDDDVIRFLQQLRGLKMLYLLETSVSKAAYKVLARKLPRCEILW
jgi:hypothetical protein